MQKIRVQMPQGVSSVSVAGQHYEPDDKGVVTLQSPEHVAPLVAHGGVELGADGKPGEVPGLIGTDKFPAEVEIRDGEEPRQLSAIVAATHAQTGISESDWNNLPQPIRDLLISLYVAQERGDFGPVGDLREQLETVTAEREELRKRAEEAESKAGDHEAASGRASADLEGVKGELAAAQAELATTRKDLEAAQAEIGELKKPADKAKKGAASEG